MRVFNARSRRKTLHQIKDRLEVFAKNALNPSENSVPECNSVAGVKFPGFFACIVLDAGRPREFQNLPG